MDLKQRELEQAQHIFFSNGTQYYIAGRFAAHTGLTPVAGNILHHAIEQFLKGSLTKTKSLQKLKDLNHNFPKIWGAFKGQANDASLVRFDDMISKLDKFERLRYPDSVVNKGALVNINITKAAAADVAAMAKNADPQHNPASSLPDYRFCLEEIDELVPLIFAATSLEPKGYFRMGFKPAAWEYLVKDNMVSAIVDAVPAFETA